MLLCCSTAFWRCYVSGVASLCATFTSSQSPLRYFSFFFLLCLLFCPYAFRRPTLRPPPTCACFLFVNFLCLFLLLCVSLVIRLLGPETRLAILCFGKASIGSSIRCACWRWFFKYRDNQTAVGSRPRAGKRSRDIRSTATRFFPAWPVCVCALRKKMKKKMNSGCCTCSPSCGPHPMCATEDN